MNKALMAKGGEVGHDVFLVADPLTSNTPVAFPDPEIILAVEVI